MLRTYCRMPIFQWGPVPTTSFVTDSYLKHTTGESSNFHTLLWQITKHMLEQLDRRRHMLLTATKCLKLVILCFIKEILRDQLTSFEKFQLYSNRWGL